MKYWMLLLSLGLFGFLGAPRDAQAGNFHLRIGPSNAWGYNTGYHQWRTGPRHGAHRHCQPRYKVRTTVVDRCRRRKVGYTSCGRRYVYHVTVITYRDHYSDGTCRTYTRRYRS